MAHTDLLKGWDSEEFTAAGITHQVWRMGSGPGVVLIHEIPGITPTVAQFANEVAAAGFRVALPLLVGSVGPAPTAGYLARSFTKVCVSREFTTWATGHTSPVVAWLRALGRHLHHETGKEGIGAIGMCFSGGFVLGMMVDDHLRAAVASQPSLPLAVGSRRSADLGISPADAAAIAERAGDCQVLALRYTGDRLVGNRFSSLRNLLGDSLLTVELPSGSSRDHSVLTEHRNHSAVAEVLEFLCSRLQKSD
jgi:dienelactone hydrolase